MYGSLSGGSYDVAQVCENGHVTNDSFFRFPEHNVAYCTTCGARTITMCPRCNGAIRGEFHVPDVVTIGGATAPAAAYCHSCGAPMPWTTMRLGAAEELIGEFDALSDDERSQLVGTLDDLVSDTPRTQVAASRFKRLAGKAGHTAADGLRSILVDVMSEAARKAIWGPGA